MRMHLRDLLCHSLSRRVTESLSHIDGSQSMFLSLRLCLYFWSEHYLHCLCTISILTCTTFALSLQISSFFFFVKTKISPKKMSDKRNYQTNGCPKRYFTKKRRKKFWPNKSLQKKKFFQIIFSFLYWGPRDFGFKIMFDLKKFGFQSLMILYQIYLFLWKS